MTRHANRKLVFNFTRAAVVCEHVLVADRPLQRIRGLMGRRALARSEGLVLRPASAIHTGFMRFPIDAIFLGGDRSVLKVVERLQPWRMAWQRGARAVLELPAGECARQRVGVGDRVGVLDATPELSRIAV
jgi:uncharacterized protein